MSPSHVEMPFFSGGLCPQGCWPACPQSGRSGFSESAGSVSLSLLAARHHSRKGSTVTTCLTRAGGPPAVSGSHRHDLRFLCPQRSVSGQDPLGLSRAPPCGPPSPRLRRCAPCGSSGSAQSSSAHEPATSEARGGRGRRIQPRCSPAKAISATCSGARCPQNSCPGQGQGLTGSSFLVVWAAMAPQGMWKPLDHRALRDSLAQIVHLVSLPLAAAFIARRRQDHSDRLPSRGPARDSELEAESELSSPLAAPAVRVFGERLAPRTHDGIRVKLASATVLGSVGASNLKPSQPPLPQSDSDLRQGLGAGPQPEDPPF